MKPFFILFLAFATTGIHAQEASRTLIKSFGQLNCDSFHCSLPIDVYIEPWESDHWRTEMEITINEKLGKILKTLIFSGRYSIHIEENGDVCTVDFPDYKALEKIGKVSLDEEMKLTIRIPSVKY